MEGLCYCSQCMRDRYERGRMATDVSAMKDVWLRQALRGSCTECCQCDPEGAKPEIKRIDMLIPGFDRRVLLSEDLLAALGLRKRTRANRRLKGIEHGDMMMLRRVPACLRACVSRRQLSLLGAALLRRMLCVQHAVDV